MGRSAGKTILIIMIIIGLIILIWWLVKGRKVPLGVIPQRLNPYSRRKSDEDEPIDTSFLESRFSGSPGRPSAGGGISIPNLQSRFTDSARLKAYNRPSDVKVCGFWDIICKLSNFFSPKASPLQEAIKGKPITGQVLENWVRGGIRK